MPELQKRIADTIAYLTTIDDAAMADSQQRTVTLSFGTFKPTFTGEQYLLTFALPNFFFHVTTAYDILRHKGVVIGKRDYLGPSPDCQDPRVDTAVEARLGMRFEQVIPILRIFSVQKAAGVLSGLSRLRGRLGRSLRCGGSGLYAGRP